MALARHEPLEDHIHAEFGLYTLGRLFFQQLAAVLREFAFPQDFVIFAELLAFAVGLRIFQKTLDVDAVRVELARGFAEQRRSVLLDAVAEIHCVTAEEAVSVIERITELPCRFNERFLPFELSVGLEDPVELPELVEFLHYLPREVVAELIFLELQQLGFVKPLSEMFTPILSGEFQRLGELNARVSENAVYSFELPREEPLDQICDDLAVFTARERYRGSVAREFQRPVDDLDGDLYFRSQRELHQLVDLCEPIRRAYVVIRLWQLPHLRTFRAD